MKIHFVSIEQFEKWDWRNSVDKGIGGSETSAVEMAWRLARRGHEVTCFAPIPDDCPGEWRGTFWKPTDEFDPTEDGLWILYRSPALLDRFGPRRPEQPRWLMSQDAWYPDLSPARADKLDRVLVLCQDHATHTLAAHPHTRGKLWLTSNGVKVDLIRTLERAGTPARNPKKLVYASSPDRGLVPLLQIFQRAREYVEDLELHVFYGFDNIDKLLAAGQPWALRLFTGFKAEVQRLLQQPGVVWRGRVSQNELYREWLSAGLWVYPTDFTETSCITCMEAQALGAIPITRPLWALRDNVRWGVFIDGSPANDALVRARYVGEIVRWTRTSELQDRYRTPMMAWARERHNWERQVDQWESDLLGLPPCIAQQVFQHKHMAGRTLNVGCDADLSGFAKRGAVNMDVLPVSPITKLPNAYSVLHDARDPFPECLGVFDTVILGEILEHVSPADGIRVLTHAAQALTPTGRVIITVPDDGHRDPRDQHLLPTVTGEEEYAPGVNAYHHRPISRADVEGQLQSAGLRTVWYEPLDYTIFEGHGIVAVRA